MNRETALTVVVPVYNGGENIRNWWVQASPHLPRGARVRLVYDFPEDNTLPEAERPFISAFLGKQFLVVATKPEPRG